MKKKIKILHFPIGNMGGGITRYTLNLWRFIDKSRFQFDFATMLHDKLPIEDTLILEGCKVFHIQYYAEDNELEFCNTFSNILKNNHYDVVLLHTRYWKSLSAERVAKCANIPRVIIYAHNTNVASGFASLPPESETKRHETIRRSLSPDIATDFWACSRVASKFLYGDSIPPKSIRIMPPAIEVENFAFNNYGREYIRKRYNLSNDNFVIGNIGRFVYQKNQEFLIKIMKKITEKNQKIKLLLVGKGENDVKYRQLVDELNLNGNILFTGFISDEDRFSIFSAFDLFALPSRFEGLPGVLLEAQAAGLRCLVSDRVTKEAKVTDDVDFLPLDEKRWVDAIVAVSKTPMPHHDTSRQMTKAGYNIREQIKIIEDAYSCSNLLPRCNVK